MGKKTFIAITFFAFTGLLFHSASLLLTGAGTMSQALAMGMGGGSNTAPVAHAGFDQSIAVDDTVVLNGTRSTDTDGDEVTQSWSITSKPASSTASLSSTTVMRPTFTADLAGDYVIELTVNDGTVDSTADSVTISTSNVAPVADAGIDRAIATSTTVELDGTASSDADGDAITYSWTLTTKPGGSTASLSSSTAARPTFTVDVAGDYVADLTVSDGTLTSAAATVTYSTGNITPVADAGPNKTEGVLAAIILDGVASHDANGDQLSYAWSVLSSAGSISLGDADLLRSGIAFSAGGDYVIQLIVNDGTADSTPKNVVITTGNTTPEANAGPDQAATVSTEITLDGAASSDDNGNAITYIWALINQPSSSTATLSDATAVRPTFTPDVAGTYIAQLIINDGTTTSRPDTVVISTDNIAPLADAGPDQFEGGNPATMQLDGTGTTDVDDVTINFNWTLIHVPNRSNAVLSDSTAQSPTFNRDKAGTYIAQLIVDDGTSEGRPTNVFISAPGNGPPTDDTNVRPVADAGADQSVTSSVLVQLDGQFSTDAQGETITFRWAIIKKPASSTAALSSTTIEDPTFTADVAGTYVVQLFVRDPRVDSLPDIMVVTAD